MDVTGDRREKVVSLPGNVLEKFNGFSFDFGGSVIKVAYLSKKEQSKDNNKLHLISFAREDFDKCIEFLKENCYIRRKSCDDKPIMYTTGLGGFQYGQRVERELLVRTENVAEYDCIQLTLEILLNNLPLTAFCTAVSKESSDIARQQVRALIQNFVVSNKEGLTNVFVRDDMDEILGTVSEDVTDVKSYCLASCGSSWFVMQRHEERISLTNWTSFGGRSFQGLGCLLTGTKTYGELIELAENGTNMNLDMTFEDSTRKSEDSKQEEDIYSKMGTMSVPPRVLFGWGKAVGKDISDFEREDVARTILATMCHHLAITAYDSLMISNSRHIFIAGSFIDHPLVQRLVVDEFEYRKYLLATSNPKLDANYNMHILDYGSHFGAIGAIIKGHGLSG